MENFIKESDLFLTKKRSDIINIMNDTISIELLDVGNYSTLKYYKMTKEEYENNKLYNYIFIFFINKFPNENEKIEGFVYDVRKLLKEKYFFLNDDNCFIPIPLSSKRWNYILKNYSNLNSLTNKSGILLFPLYKSELIYLFKNLKNLPIVCSSLETCYSIDLKDLDSIKIIKIFDKENNLIEETKKENNLIEETKKENNLIEETKNENNLIEEIKNENNLIEEIKNENNLIEEIKNENNLIEETKNENNLIEEKKNEIINFIEKQLDELEINDEEILKKLHNNDTRKYIISMLNDNKMEIQIISAMLSDILSSFVNK